MFALRQAFVVRIVGDYFGVSVCRESLWSESLRTREIRSDRPCVMKNYETFPAMLRDRASAHPSRSAIVFVDDQGAAVEITYEQLWKRSLAVAAGLHRLRGEMAESGRTLPDAPRAMLLFPPGLDFLPAFVGVQLAGWVPVPTIYPKPHRANPRLDASAQDCQASVILTDAASLATLDPRRSAAIVALPCLAVDQLAVPASDQESRWLATAPDRGSIAFLQYTSGSTSEPKGVVISQRNLMSNLEAIRIGFGLDFADDHPPSSAAEDASSGPLTAVFWLPHFHDMGLIGGLLCPLYLGGRTVLMSPQSFIRRPISWLELLSGYRAAVTGAPNFAFELCVERISPAEAEGLDLSALRVLFCGAEPIRASSLRRFQSRFEQAGLSDDRFYPCYGLAESTLLAAGGDGPGRLRLLDVDRQTLAAGQVKVGAGPSAKTSTVVSCGRAVGDGELVVVDAATGEPLGEQCVGEIWIRGSSVAARYWKATPQDAARFDAQLVRPRRGLTARPRGSEPELQGGFFRTGDLGFIYQGELHVTGRLKELIIIRGRNYFPQDIEATVSQVLPAAVGRVVALCIDSPSGESLGVVAEVARHTASDDWPAIARQIRIGVLEEHEIDPREVVLVRPSGIPTTTSGKVQRVRCHQWFTSRDEACLYRWQRSGGTESPTLEMPALPARPQPADFEAINRLLRDWIVRWLIERGGVDPVVIDIERPFDSYGLDSLTAIRLIADLEDGWGVELTPMVAWEHPTIAALGRLIAMRICHIPEPVARATGIVADGVTPVEPTRQQVPTSSR